MKKVLSLCLIIVLSFGMITSSFANIPNYDTKNSKIKKVVFELNGVKYELDVQNYKREIKELLANQKPIKKKNINFIKEKIIQPKGMTDDWYRYDEDETGIVPKYSERMIYSDYFYNETSRDQQHSFECEETTGWESSINGGISKNVLATGVSYSWNSSETYSETITETVAEDKYGWIEMVPMMNYSKGEYKTFSWLGNEKDSKEITIYNPRENKPSRLFFFKESSTEPF